MATRLRYAVLITAVGVLMAPELHAQKVGSTSMQYLSVVPCARAAALGSAYVALASGVDGIFWNPAGMALTRGQEFSTTYISWIFDARQYALAYAHTLGDYGVVGAQFQYVDYGKFDEASYPAIGDYHPGQTLPFLTGRTFKPYSYVAGLTYASQLTDRFSAGITVKYAHESLYDQSTILANMEGLDSSLVNTYGQAFLFDVGIHYNTGFHTVQVGIAVQNFGPEIKYAVDKNSAPMLFRVGVAADLLGENSLLLEDKNSRLGLSFDLYQSNDYDQQQHLGIEYAYAKTIALRAGYKFNYDIEGMTFGGGARTTIGSMSVTFDYSYGSADSDVGTFGNIHRISLGVGLQ